LYRFIFNYFCNRHNFIQHPDRQRLESHFAALRPGVFALKKLQPEMNDNEIRRRKTINAQAQRLKDAKILR
jgi:hypothetical protein